MKLLKNRTVLGVLCMKNNQNLFFSPEEKGRAFSDVLKEVQEYISSKYSTLMVEGGSEEVKQQVKCAEEVKRINGVVRFEEAYQYQQGDRF